METDRGTHPVPVEGEIIRDSPLKTLGVCLPVIFVLAPLGAGLIWAWWTEASLADRRISWYGALLGALFVLGGICAVPLSFLCVFWRSRLIIGKECFQLVARERVTLQIPYRNIDRIGLDKEEGAGEFVGIDLQNLHEAGTLCPGVDANKVLGWHYALKDGPWSVPLTYIHDEIRARMPRRLMQT